MDRLSVWLERLSALHRNLLRTFANQEGLQLVHVEILRYLSACNRYSNTSGALTEYLGQTKGSISQSVAFLETNQWIKRTRDPKDKRSYHLELSAKGQRLVTRLEAEFKLESDPTTPLALQELLRQLQTEHGLRSFGVCATCKYNQNPQKDVFRCGLTNEELTLADVGLLCREHEESE
ncbi:MAG: winged helix-turn-helix transcriptional regulator [Bdellovibrionales bacterium]|nr:winged helix-turn-helix transcriptional regulator [Bdellovibrionales bacterium]